jgi:hypothetical protein
MEFVPLGYICIRRKIPLDIIEKRDFGNFRELSGNHWVTNNVYLSFARS